MTQRFGDFFHEIPEPEIFPLPCGGFVSSECVINSLGMTYTIEVIPRRVMLHRLNFKMFSDNIALGFRVSEIAGSGRASVYLEAVGVGNGVKLAEVDADSLPIAKQVAA